MWFVVWASLPIKNSGHAYKLEIAWKKFLKIFFFGEHAAVFLVLGLEHSCPWAREGLSSKRLSLALASDFFVFLALASSLVSSTPPLWSSINYIQGSKLTPTRLLEASWNRFGQVTFQLNFSDGKLTKYSVLDNFKQDYLKTQFTRFCCNKIKFVRKENCFLLYFSKHFVPITINALSNSTHISLLIAINTS